MMAWRTWILLLLSLSGGCSQFNYEVSSQSFLGMVSQAGNFLRLYSVSSSGALSLAYSASVTSPRGIAGNPVDQAIYVNSATTSIECFFVNYRQGTGIELLSSTSVSGLQALVISPDGKHLYYGNSGNKNIYYRTVDKCTLGSEQTVTGVDDPVTAIAITSDGGTVVTVDTEATVSGPHKYTRDSETGALTFVASGTGARSPLVLTPTEHAIISKGAGATTRSFLLSTMAMKTSIGTTPVALYFYGASQTDFYIDVGGATPYAVDLTTGTFATLGVGAAPNYTDVNGGSATVSGFSFVGSQGNLAIFRQNGVGGVSAISTGSAPTALVRISGYQRR